MSLLSTFTKEPDAETTLADLRLRQWRRPSRNPFEPTNSEPDIDYAEDLAENVPHLKRRPAVRSRSTRSGRSGVNRSGTSQTLKSKHSEPDSEHPELKHPGSKWVHLFYDLAWTASFASLTQNGKFQNPLDTLNYFLFFAAVMWLWASQTLYSIHFYTNDWFHLMSTFLQLFVFGMLSATTLGYDVTTYIVHSPGTDTLHKSDDKDDNDPQRFIDEKTARLSMLVLAVAFASTRFIHLVQYLRVLYYARWSTRINQVKDKSNTNQSGADPQVPMRPWIEHIPSQLKFITSGLLISNPMFIAALVISALSFGQTITGASLKLGLWFGGFLVELLSHLSIPVYRWVTKRIRLINNDPPHGEGSGSGSKHGGNSNVSISSGYELPLSPGMDLCERLQTVTTIILGEGINGIAGTLSAVMVAPGAGRAVVVNVISAACTIWFIAYIYFEGPKGDKAPQTKSLRYILWLILHLPFLASTVLLLIGIKNQFLLTGFLSALFGATTGFNIKFKEQLEGVASEALWRNNTVINQFLLERGIVWEEEVDKLVYAFGNATKDRISPPTATEVWSLRLSLTMALNAFKDFNKGDDDIINSLKPNLTEYYNNTTLVIQDLEYNRQGQPHNGTYFKILSQLLEGTLQSTRCIIAFAGLILMSLSLQDLIHSVPRDRYQWGVIVSRFLMGIVLCLLLLLNIGKYQTLFVPVGHKGQRAGVFLWLEKFWVSPTIAIAYAVQCFVEIALSRFAKRSTKKATEAAAIAEETEKEIDACDKAIPMTDSPRERALV